MQAVLDDIAPRLPQGILPPDYQLPYSIFVYFGDYIQRGRVVDTISYTNNSVDAAVQKILIKSEPNGNNEYSFDTEIYCNNDENFERLLDILKLNGFRYSAFKPYLLVVIYKMDGNLPLFNFLDLLNNVPDINKLRTAVISKLGITVIEYPQDLDEFEVPLNESVGGKRGCTFVETIISKKPHHDLGAAVNDAGRDERMHMGAAAGVEQDLDALVNDDEAGQDDLMGMERNAPPAAPRQKRAWSPPPD